MINKNMWINFWIKIKCSKCANTYALQSHKILDVIIFSFFFAKKNLLRWEILRLHNITKEIFRQIYSAWNKKWIRINSPFPCRAVAWDQRGNVAKNDGVQRGFNGSSRSRIISNKFAGGVRRSIHRSLKAANLWTLVRWANAHASVKWLSE